MPLRIKYRCSFNPEIRCYEKSDCTPQCPRYGKGSQATLSNIEVKKIEQAAVKRGTIPKDAKIKKVKEKKGVKTTFYKVEK